MSLIRVATALHCFLSLSAVPQDRKLGVENGGRTEGGPHELFMPLISEPAATAKGREDGQWIHVIGWRTPLPPPDVRFLFGNVCTNFGLLSVVVPPPPDAPLYAPTSDSCPMFPPGKNRSSFVKFTFQCQKKSYLLTFFARNILEMGGTEQYIKGRGKEKEEKGAESKRKKRRAGGGGRGECGQYCIVSLPPSSLPSFFSS